MLDHRHIIVSAHGLSRPPMTAQEIESWFTRLVDAVGMTTLIGPYAIRCNTMGNEGVTGIVCIETSHASVHVWDSCDEPFLKMDLYSCMHFDVSTVIDLVREFGPEYTSYMLIDRNGRDARLLEQGAFAS